LATGLDFYSSCKQIEIKAEDTVAVAGAVWYLDFNLLAAAVEVQAICQFVPPRLNVECLNRKRLNPSACSKHMFIDS
jgi:hypothetical protein